MDQLERMLATPLFSHSKRYAPFLQHVVKKTLEGQEDSLKERILGVELFDRDPNYDSNNDPVVRVTAGEVRKRIAQYYDDSVHRSEFRIDLPLGTYVAQFHPGPPIDEEHRAAPQSCVLPTEQAPSPEPLSQVSAVEVVEGTRRPRRRLVASVLVLAVLTSAGLVWKLGRREPSTLDLVWGNVASARSSSVISMGEPRLYPLENTTGEVSARQHLRSDYVTFSDLQALVRVLKLLDSKSAGYRLQPASSTSFADLRQGPAILLGGLDNPWTMRAQQNLRFRMASDGNGFDWIFDSRDPAAKRWFVDFNRPYSKVTTDYAIIALFRDPGTQQPTLAIAGLGENGTKAASEFITDDTRLQDALGASQRKPGSSGFEVVITTEVVNGSSGVPVVVAKEVW
jgi:hypothetical protein